MSEEVRPPDKEAVSQTRDLPAEFCPVCSSKLQSRHCKMLCARCGYFMSCAEFE